MVFDFVSAVSRCAGSVNYPSPVPFVSPPLDDRDIPHVEFLSRTFVSMTPLFKKLVSNLGVCPSAVESTLTISWPVKDAEKICGIIFQGNLYLHFPCSLSIEWMDVKRMLTLLMELGEDQLECEKLFFCVDKAHLQVKPIVQALLMIGFSLVDPRYHPIGDSVLALGVAF